MRRNILWSILFVTGILSSVPTLPYAISLLGCNMGVLASLNMDIQSYHYRNYGKIYALGLLNISTSTLSHSGTIRGGYTHITCTDYRGNGTVIGGTVCSIKAKRIKSSGIIQGAYVDIVCDAFTCSGKDMICRGLGDDEECHLTGKQIALSGCLQSKKVTIMCDELTCDGGIWAQECTIYVKRPFDCSTLVKNPYGKYTVIVAEYGFEPHTRQSLAKAVLSKFSYNYMNIADEDIREELRALRSYARLNHFDDRKILEKTKALLEKKLRFVEDHFNYDYGSAQDLGASMAAGVGGTLGLVAACSYYTYMLSEHRIPHTLYIPEAVALWYSLKLYYASCIKFKEWYSPCYTKKYRKLSAVIEELERSLRTNDVPEELVLIS